MSDSSFTFQLELGVLIRREVVFQIRAFAQREGFGCEVLEDKGLLSSGYQFKITGPAEQLGSFRSRLKAGLARMSDGS